MSIAYGTEQGVATISFDRPAKKNAITAEMYELFVARLADEEPAAAEVVKLRYFAGLTVGQTAESLGISVRTANRHWAYARAWLYQQLSQQGGSGPVST